jgi:hypothetical protein
MESDFRILVCDNEGMAGFVGWGSTAFVEAKRLIANACQVLTKPSVGKCVLFRTPFPAGNGRSCTKAATSHLLRCLETRLDDWRHWRQDLAQQNLSRRTRILS